MRLEWNLWWIWLVATRSFENVSCQKLLTSNLVAVILPMICLVETASSRGTPSQTIFDTLPSPTPSSFKNSLFLCLNIQLLYLIIFCLFYFQVNREYRQVDPSLDHKSSSCVYIYVSLPWLVRLWTLIRTDYYYYVNSPIKAERKQCHVFCCF